MPRSPLRRPRARAAAVVATLAAALLLSGCVSAFLPPTAPTTSTPTREKVAAELAPYYHQKLTWSRCADSMQCATAKAPLDWSDPGGARIDLALIRHYATGQRQGSLLVNPGGPGGSGYDFVRDSLDFAVDKQLQRSFDIVGFDPRGVQHSTAVRCYTDPADFTEYLYGITPGTPGSDAWTAASEASAKSFGADCARLTGPLLGHVDTVSAARDLDMLRAALGDTRLNYLGYSYGTLLGATYADLFPTKTGRLVLDGALDPTSSGADVTEIQTKGFESAFTAYLKSCLGSKGCPFTGTVAQAKQKTRALLDSLTRTPLRGSDGRLLGDQTMFTAIIYPLYSQQSWPALDKLFSEVFRGGTDTAFQLADEYNGRTANGSYSDNSTEAFIAINCLDYGDDASDPATMRADAEKLIAEAPLFGPEMAWGTPCAGWPYAPTRERGPITAAGSAPILVVGTTNDPATPYVWAKSLAAQLQKGHLVTYHGEGHTAYNKSNSCVDDAVDAFFVKGTVPARDPNC